MLLKFGLGPSALLALASPAVAVPASRVVYVTSYAGTITSLNFTGAELKTVYSNVGGCGDASWLTLDYANSVLYCLDEGLDGHKGSLSSYATLPDGSLLPSDRLSTIVGPVSSVPYGNAGRGLAIAHYGGSAVTAYNTSSVASLQLLEEQVFNISAPGPNPVRQDAPHPHEAILDPTGGFLLVPDLGADLVRVFSINRRKLTWSVSTPLVAAPGSGPRHAAFLKAEGETYMYLISELANTITGYKVDYSSNGTLAFKQVYLSSTHGLGTTAPTGAAAAEIHVSPDHRFLMVSSRDEGSLSLPNFDSKNSTAIASDPLITFAIDPRNGNLSKIQEFPAGGLVPRQFSISKDGTLVGVGLQKDGRVAIIERDPKSGLLTKFAATADVAGQVSCVVFNEPSYA